MTLERMDLPYRAQILAEITYPELRDKILQSTPEEIEDMEHIWNCHPIEINNGRVFIEIASCWEEEDEYEIPARFFVDYASLFTAIKSPSRLIVRLDRNYGDFTDNE